MSDPPPRQVKRTNGQKARKSPWGLVFRGLVTVLIIAYLALKVNWTEIVAQLVRADFLWLMLSSIIFGMVYLLSALRWWFLMKVQGIHLPVKLVTALTFIGQFFNSFLLGSVGGDIIKALYIQKYAPNQRTYATLSIIMDRVLGLFILICGSLLVIPWQLKSLMHGNQADSVMFGLLSIFSLCGLIGLTMAVTPFHRAPQPVRAMWERIPNRHIIELVISGFRQHGVALKYTLASIAAGAVMTTLLVAAGYCIAIGIGLSATYMQMFVIMTVVICVISLPISIGGHGVREGIFVIMFAASGVIGADQKLGSSEEMAVLFSLLFFSIPLIWSLVGGIIYLFFRHDLD